MEHLPAIRADFVPQGIIFPNDMTLDEWTSAGDSIAYLNKTMQFVVGDWVNFGEAMFGEKYAQALDHTSYSYQTLRNASYVCNKIPLERRRHSLTFEHHRLCAPLNEEEQVKMLDLAENMNLTTAELRAEIKKLKGEPPKANKSYADWLEWYCQQYDYQPSNAEIKFGEEAWNGKS